MRFLLAFLLLAAGGAAHGKQHVRYHFELGEVLLAPSAPAELSVKARSVFDALVAARPEIVGRLDGAPDPAKDPVAYRRYLDRHGVRSYALKIKIDQYDRSLGPATDPGKRGNVLKVHLDVSLVGSQIPGNALALAGSGGSTVIADVGATLRPGEEEGARDDALKDALSHALDDALAKLDAPAKAPRKKRR